MKGKVVRGERERERIREYERQEEDSEEEKLGSTEAIVRVRALWLLTVPQQQKRPGQEEQLAYQKRGIFINDIERAPKRNQP